MINRLFYGWTYRFIYKVGIHLYKKEDGTVDWDEITLGDLLDTLYNKESLR